MTDPTRPTRRLLLLPLRFAELREAWRIGEKCFGRDDGEHEYGEYPLGCSYCGVNAALDLADALVILAEQQHAMNLKMAVKRDWTCQHNRASDGTPAGEVCHEPAVLCETHGGHDGCAVQLATETLAAWNRRAAAQPPAPDDKIGCPKCSWGKTSVILCDECNEKRLPKNSQPAPEPSAVEAVDVVDGERKWVKVLGAMPADAQRLVERIDSYLVPFLSFPKPPNPMPPEWRAAVLLEDCRAFFARGETR